ncbi:APC family permease [Thermoplasma sp.]|uniref:APC family permease n=1 Tax=Thermoplasma sp. TaxID=1973142 RepID=UPI001272C688|nr:APC family permease [Thermoplasma sp.]KAA8922437.1 MAG: APC family permease [Thermoplasma sp.]
MTEQDTFVKSTASDKKFRKELTTIDLLFLSLGGIIGSGWLFAAASASMLAGPAAVLSWIIGGLIVLVIALVYAELGGMIPRSGAIVRYGQYSHGGLAGFLFGWAYFLSAVSVPAIEAEGVITYAGTYVKGLVTNTGVLTGLGILLAAILMLGFFFLNYFGIKVMGKTNTGMTWWKLIIPSATVALLLAVHFNISNFFLKTGFVTYGWSSVFEAISVSGIVFSYLGFRQALDYGGEAKNPQKSVPIATVLSVVIGIALYALLQVVFIGQVNWAAVGVPAGDWSALTGGVVTAPFATLASSAGLVFLSYFLFADAYVSPSGTLNVYLGTSQRTLYGLGTLGYLGKSMSDVNKKTRVPILPLIASLVIGYIFFAPFPSWYKLVGFISSSTVFTYIVGGSALQVFRREAAELKRPFKLGGASILSPIAFVGATLIVYWSGWPLVAYLVIAILIGLVVYAAFYLAGKSAINIFSGKHFKGGAWLLAYMGVITLLSYLGEKPYGGTGLIPFPWDFLVMIVVAIAFYFWSVLSGFKTDEITEIIESDMQYLPSDEAAQAPVGKK